MWMLISIPQMKAATYRVAALDPSGRCVRDFVTESKEFKPAPFLVSFC